MKYVETHEHDTWQSKLPADDICCEMHNEVGVMRANEIEKFALQWNSIKNQKKRRCVSQKKNVYPEA